MIKLIKKQIEKIKQKIIFFKNKVTISAFEGKITIGIENKFYQGLDLMGKGTIFIGNSCSFGYRYGGGFKNGKIEIQTRSNEAKIEIGNNIATNNNIFLCSKNKIKIEDDVLIGRNVIIMDHNAHGVKPNERRKSSGTPREIIIKRNVWIGSYVIILPGTIIGENSIVGAGSVVKGEFPKNVIIQGNPARIIKKIEIGEKNEEKI